MLEAQCGTWGGLTSAAVYWPRFVSDAPEHAAEAQEASLTAAKAQLAALHARLDEAEGALGVIIRNLAVLHDCPTIVASTDLCRSLLV